MTLQQLLDKRMPKRRPLVLPWLYQGQQAMVFAATGTGKTLVCLTIALMVAGGGRALGWVSDTPTPVLYVDGEMAEEDLQERALMLIPSIDGLDKAAAARNLHFMARTAQARDTCFPDINLPAGQSRVLEAAREHHVGLVLLDNFSVLATVADENDAAAMSPTLNFLMDLKAEKYAAILVHHSGKGTAGSETYRGSSRLATTFDVIIGLIPVKSAMVDQAGPSSEPSGRNIGAGHTKAVRRRKCALLTALMAAQRAGRLRRLLRTRCGLFWRRLSQHDTAIRRV
jgi:RecA-family ATPase